jgi:hypothetical protein
MRLREEHRAGAEVIAADSGVVNASAIRASVLLTIVM